MSDHAVLIPTSEGPVGGVVSEPDGEGRAALIALPGHGRPARSGVNGFWARLARSLAERGVVVLRIDFSREGETLPIGEGGSGQVWKRDLDLRLLAEVTPWFHGRTGGLPLDLTGVCAGSRLAIELAGREPEAISGTFHVVPHLRALVQPGDGSRPDDVDPVDPHVVECFRAILDRRPSWILVGEDDSQDVPRLQRLLGPTRHQLEVESVPGMALHFLDQPPIQEQVRRRLVARVAAALPSAARA